jgi:hypothetical protein
MKRPSNVGLPTNLNLPSCACLGGSATYYTLVQGEQFFKSSFRLSEQSSFGRSLFRPDVHVIHSHPLFEHKYNWNQYEQTLLSNEQLNDAETFYPFDFCAQQTNLDENHSHHSVPADLYSLVRTNSGRNTKRKSLIEQKHHKRSLSSIPLENDPPGSSSASTSDAYLTPAEGLSLNSASQASLNSTLNNNINESSSSTVLQQRSSTNSLPLSSNYNLLSEPLDDKQDLSITSSHSSSTDSLTALEEILQQQQIENGSTFLPEKVMSHTQQIFGLSEN